MFPASPRRWHVKKLTHNEVDEAVQAKLEAQGTQRPMALNALMQTATGVKQEIEE